MAEIYKTFMAEAEKLDPEGFARARAERAELEALRKDAERYRWLRNNCSGEPRTGDHAPAILLFGLRGAAEAVWNEAAVATNHLTETIDAAMAAGAAVGAA